MCRLNRQNIYAVANAATSLEWVDGHVYYEWQRTHIDTFAAVARVDTDRAIAAFSALSPNNAEATNYKALASVLAIHTGRIPTTAPVIAFGANKIKALALLQGADPDKLLGRKTLSFYHNTVNPDDRNYVTIDGHMLNIWHNRRMRLQARGMSLSKTQYDAVAHDYKIAASTFKISPARFQSILWLSWKRLHNIVYSAQLPFESGYSLERAKWMIECAPAYRTFSPDGAGKSTAKAIYSIHPGQKLLEFDAGQNVIVS